MDSPPTRSFIVVYRGRSASEARLVALSADPYLVATVVGQLLAARRLRVAGDPVVDAIDGARRSGLLLIQSELRQVTGDGRDPEPGA